MTSDDVEVVDLGAKQALVVEPWTPKIIAELNGQHVKLARLAGPFVWHAHEREDELFLVLSGRLRMELRDRERGERALELREGQLVVVPRGVEHRPVAEPECTVLLFEPAGTLNTGDAGGPLTVADPERI